MSAPIEPARIADLVIYNGKIATQDEQRSFVTALAVADGRIVASGSDRDVMQWTGTGARCIDLHGRTVIPGLNDSHLHIIRGGLNFNMELRWDGVPSLADALRMLREQVARTPAPQWVRVVGGWNEFQFVEKRGPTLEEINAIAPDTPVFILHLYDSALLNAAALRAVGYTRNTPNPPGGEIQRDRRGNVTGMLIARPNAGILYATLAQGPKLRFDDQMNSTRQFMRELNRLGVTSAIDAGGGYQAYPDDYSVIMELAKRNEMTVRIAYNLFTQNAKREIEDFAKWVRDTRPGDGDDFLKVNGAGEMLVFSAADFEDFLEPRPDLPEDMGRELEAVVRLLVQNRWPFRLHATYEESISRFLDVFERVNRDTPFDGLRWFFDHCETISERNIERVAALGGGIAIQHRMAFQGEYFIARYGIEAVGRTPPVRKMLEAGLPVGAGTDATRVASYNPFVALHWLVSGRTVGGTPMYAQRDRLDRMEALRRYTLGSAWFSNDDGKKGALVPGHLADFAVLSEDYFTIDESGIKQLTSVLTVVNGRVVYADAEFEALAPPALPVSPDWSPVAQFGGYARYRPAAALQQSCGDACANLCGIHRHAHAWAWRSAAPVSDANGFWGALGCSCFAI
ncbi:amidohydrolase [Paraburkholderia pallida]|uniref:Amidohydrolase n=1 Tax=Paraburkholderia pallida TaxID=2547399 RepID=A0A4P7D205_9BURK|nr:amidohydrolase [Paraburkholderia pallida]QBR01928.1 amidohydrolase [Paraburkholderia pallida]